MFRAKKTKQRPALDREPEGAQQDNTAPVEEKVYIKLALTDPRTYDQNKFWRAIYEKAKIENPNLEKRMLTFMSQLRVDCPLDLTTLPSLDSSVIKFYQFDSLMSHVSQMPPKDAEDFRISLETAKYK